MKSNRVQTILAALWISTAFCTFLSIARVEVCWTAEQPQYGGTLNFAVEVDPPSYDAHREQTYNMVHPTAPHYSLLVKFDPENYPRIVGDLAESWTISKDQKTYTFKIHKGVRFHDGSILTARDIKASYDKIIFPPPGILSVRKPLYEAVDKVEAPDDHTVIFGLKWPSASFLSFLAAPFNYVYKADILAKDPRWYEKNIMGSGPFKFVEYVAGAHWVGKRNEDYFGRGRPYLDGFKCFFIKDQGARAAAIRAGRVHTDFRGHFSPVQRDDVVRAMGDKMRFQESDLVISIIVVFNSEEKPFNDPRVRRAMTLAADRHEGLRAISRIENEKVIGGLLRPGSEFAMSESELVKVAGFSKDIESSRKEARRLLREAGVPEGFRFEFIRPPTKSYEVRAIWMIDQWRQVGLNVTQRPLDWGIFNTEVRKGNFKVAFSTISDFIDEPDLQFTKFISSDKSPLSYGRFTDRILDDLYMKQSRAMDPGERKKLCTLFQKRVLDEMAYSYPVLGWTGRITLLSPKLKGWKTCPSHVANQDLRDVWLEKD